VFYVTISERMRKDNKTWIKLKEEGVSEEQFLHKDVVIAIDETATKREESSLNYLLGYQVIFAGKELGIVEDFFSTERRMFCRLWITRERNIWFRL